MKNKVKIITALVIGIIVGTIGYVIADDMISIINANQIGFNSDKTSKTNIQEAVDELYTIARQYKKDNIEMAKIGDTYKAIVYLDPTNLSNSCNASNSTIGAGDSGCMKWYAYSETTTSYNLLLDHNTYFGDYNSSNNQITILKTRENKPWNSSLNLRMITGQEVASIVANTTWDRSQETTGFTFSGSSSIKSAFYWLYDYLDCYNYGCKVDIDDPDAEPNLRFGYWTSDYTCDANDSSCSNLWHINRGGGVTFYNKDISAAGFRPVITVNKSTLGI